MNKRELILKIISKKEFSELPGEDVELAFLKFDKKNITDYQKLKFTRSFLRKVYSSFSSRKLLVPKEKDSKWILMKHKSTKERGPFYPEVYSRILKGFEKRKRVSIVDLGCGVNGFSFELLKKINPEILYKGVEAIGQLCDISNDYFKRNGFGAEVLHFSLFNFKKLMELIKNTPTPRIVLLFKVVDSLEIMKRNYSKELLVKIAPFSEKIAVSFATRSLGARKKFSAQRGWLIKFIKENFEVLDDFELGGERYIVFSKKGL